MAGQQVGAARSGGFVLAGGGLLADWTDTRPTRRARYHTSPRRHNHPSLHPAPTCREPESAQTRCRRIQRRRRCWSWSDWSSRRSGPRDKHGSQADREWSTSLPIRKSLLPPHTVVRPPQHMTIHGFAHACLAQSSSQSSPTTRSSPRKPPPTHTLPPTTSNDSSASTFAQNASSANVASTSGGSATSASTASITTLPTPLSISPSLSHLSSTTKLPPAFADSHPRTHARYPSSHTPFSPYRPGEYGRSERGIASERTKIRKVERRLFDDGSSTQYSGERGAGQDGRESKDEEVTTRAKEDELVVPKLNVPGGKDVQGSSPLAPAFEAKMVLRNGASVDLISW